MKFIVTLIARIFKMKFLTTIIARIFKMKFLTTLIAMLCVVDGQQPHEQEHHHALVGDGDDANDSDNDGNDDGVVGDGDDANGDGVDGGDDDNNEDDNDEDDDDDSDKDEDPDMWKLDYTTPKCLLDLSNHVEVPFTGAYTDPHINKGLDAIGFDKLLNIISLLINMVPHDGNTVFLSVGHGYGVCENLLARILLPFNIKVICVDPSVGESYRWSSDAKGRPIPKIDQLFDEYSHLSDIPTEKIDGKRIILFINWSFPSYRPFDNDGWDYGYINTLNPSYVVVVAATNGSAGSKKLYSWMKNAGVEVKPRFISILPQVECNHHLLVEYTRQVITTHYNRYIDNAVHHRLCVFSNTEPDPDEVCRYKLPDDVKKMTMFLC